MCGFGRDGAIHRDDATKVLVLADEVKRVAVLDADAQAGSRATRVQPLGGMAAAVSQHGLALARLP
eukprot:2766813-Heterocapsa_arctica.AAC.1